jgi:hypothetical protein
MKNVFKLFFLAAVILSSCDSSKKDNAAVVEKAPVVEKTEDEKMTEALVGEFFEDDRTEDDGSVVRNIRYHFYKDGKFDGKATYEYYDPEIGDLISLTIKVTGTWKIKDKFIYYTYDEVTSDFPNFNAEAGLDEIRKKNSPDKVIEYDAAKVIYENVDGERRTMKKSY